MKLGFISLDYCEVQDEGTSQKVTFKCREEESSESKSKLLPSAVQAAWY